MEGIVRERKQKERKGWKGKKKRKKRNRKINKNKIFILNKRIHLSNITINFEKYEKRKLIIFVFSLSWDGLLIVNFSKPKASSIEWTQGINANKTHFVSQLKMGGKCRAKGIEKKVFRSHIPSHTSTKIPIWSDDDMINVWLDVDAVEWWWNWVSDKNWKIKRHHRSHGNQSEIQNPKEISKSETKIIS